MRSVAFTSAVMAALATIALADCPPLPTVTLPINQYVPENHGLDGPRLWQLAVCSPATYAQCGTIPASYVIEINGNGDGCDVGFNKDMSFGQWTSAYGGLNTFFSGTASISDDRIANVTLICDPSATTPTADGPVVAYSAQAGTVWNFDIRVKTSVACGGPNPPPPPPPPPPPFPPGPTPPTPPGPPPPPGPPAPEKKEEKTSWVAILFVVLVFLTPAVYVGAFVAYNYFKLGKRGVGELLPHPEFWKDFPVLCLDGCKFVKNKFMQLIGKGDGSGSYGGASEGSYTKV